MLSNVNLNFILTYFCQDLFYIIYMGITQIFFTPGHRLSSPVWSQLIRFGRNLISGFYFFWALHAVRTKIVLLILLFH